MENPVISHHIIFPGDSLRVHCIYNSSTVEANVDGGFGFPDEMVRTFLKKFSDFFQKQIEKK